MFTCAGILCYYCRNCSENILGVECTHFEWSVHILKGNSHPVRFFVITSCDRENGLLKERLKFGLIQVVYRLLSRSSSFGH